jgi:Na+/proline symporter
VLGVLVGIAAVLLEGVSLLKLDIFSGIIFAAPTSAFLAGLLWKRTRPIVAVISIFAGLISGLTAWLVIQDENLNWFVGNMLALFLPAVVIVLGSIFPGKYRYDYGILKQYEPTHNVNVSEEA